MSRSNINVNTIVKTLLGRSPGGVLFDEDREAYQRYLKNTRPDEETLEAQRNKDQKGLPLFAVVIVGEDREGMKLTAESLAAQTYKAWKLTESPYEGDWQYMLYMRPGDMLTADALYRFAHAASGHDLLYCDEDRMGTEGRERPVFKICPNMMTQLSYDMLGSGVAVSRELFAAAGAMKGDTADDRYGYNIRCLKRAANPLHIPNVLYTCSAYSKPSGQARIHVEKAAGKGNCVMGGKWQGSFKVEAAVKKPDIAAVISCKNNCEPLMRLLMSIDRASASHRPDIIIADRGSTDPKTLRYYEILKRNGAAKVHYGGEVCMPKLLNDAAAEADGDVTVFMESNTEVLSHNWLGELLVQAMREGTAAAGPKVLDKDGRLLHCGTVIGIKGWQGSPYRGSEDDAKGERKRIFTDTLRPVSALSAVCMMVRTETFFNVGCFDESFEDVGFDTEFCLRMAGRGYASIYTPWALVKYSGDFTDIQNAGDEDIQRFYDAARATLAEGDPYYSINYDMNGFRPYPAARPLPPIYLNSLFNEK